MHDLTHRTVLLVISREEDGDPCLVRASPIINLSANLDTCCSRHDTSRCRSSHTLPRSPPLHRTAAPQSSNPMSASDPDSHPASRFYVCTYRGLREAGVYLCNVHSTTLVSVHFPMFHRLVVLTSGLVSLATQTRLSLVHAPEVSRLCTFSTGARCVGAVCCFAATKDGIRLFHITSETGPRC